MESQVQSGRAISTDRPLRHDGSDIYPYQRADPWAKDHFLINNYGIAFDEMRASDLVKIDYDGNIVDKAEETKRVNKAGLL